jgi:signal transduction histidine kinase
MTLLVLSVNNENNTAACPISNAIANITASHILLDISKNEIGVSADELTQRFVRGDASRSGEGSGLGLSIAQNLCELQGGRFKVEIDGDLFKVTVSLPKAE